jgi:hypothetical protein
MPLSLRRACAALAAVAACAAVPASAPAHPGHHHAGFPGSNPAFFAPFPKAGPTAGGYAENVEFVKNFPQHTDSAGARRLGDHFYITTERDLTIYDITAPANPVQVGYLQFEEPGQPVFSEEDPDTNGRILLVSNDVTNTDTGRLMVIDVSDKTSPEILATVPGVDEHTYTCVLDCTWAYGSEGTIVDLRDPAKPRVSESNWQTADIESEHDVTEVSPGMIVTSTQPLKLLDAREDPEHPKVVASTAKEEKRFVHANLWPNGGTDDWLLVGGEAVGPDCSGSISATFSTWDARAWRETGAIRQVDEFRILPGTPLEGRAPESSFCVHWFDEHPYYKNGGLIAIGWYEHGTHFLKIGRDGSIEEVGFFLGGGGQSSAAYWIDERTVYVSDYLRGLDVLRFTGDIGSPPAPDEGTKGTTGGSDPAPAPANDSAPPPPATAATNDGAASTCTVPNGFRSASAGRSGNGLRFDFRRTSAQPVDIDLFRQSEGRRITGEQRVERFRGLTEGITWNDSGPDGYYFARFRTRTTSGVDTRRIALRRRDGRWSTRPAFYRPASCDLLRSFKLGRPVFGGIDRRALGISYRVAREADVRVTVRRGSRVVQRFDAAKAAPGRTHRLRFDAAGRPRGDYRVTVEATRGDERVTATAVSRRL